MVSPALIALWVLALGTLGVATALAFRAESAVQIQERAAERLSWAPPSEHPDYYAETREHRIWTFRFGGTVLLLAGSLLLAAAVYATLFVDSFPA